MRGAVAGDGEMLVVGAFGRGLRGRNFLEAAGDDDIQAAAGGAHDQGRTGGNGQRAGGRQRCRLLVGGRQDHRRLAGVERRRDPGVDADIGRRQHTVPVESSCEPQSALIARGKEGRDQHHHDQRAQRPGVVDGEARVRQTGADALERGQRALALRLPERLCDRILRGQRVGERGGGAVANARAAVEPGERLVAARPAKPNQGEQGGGCEPRENDEADGTGGKGQHQPQTGPGHRQKQADDGQDSHKTGPGTLPRDGIS